MIPRDEDTFECVSRERTGVWVGKPFDFPKDGVCVCVLRITVGSLDQHFKFVRQVTQAVIIEIYQMD